MGLEGGGLCPEEAPEDLGSWLVSLLVSPLPVLLS